jgi:hypothetical protein
MRERMALKLCWVQLVLALFGGCLMGSEPANAPLTWATNRSEVMAAAKAQGKFVLLLAGRDTCSNCQTMKEIVAESENPPIKTLISDYFIPWYSNIDDSTDFLDYTAGLSANWVLPLICVIDPDDLSAQYLDRSTGVQQAPVFYQRLLRHANVLMVRPRITGFEPAQGNIGTRVRIMGNNLTNANQVLFKGVAAFFTIADTGVLEAEVPPGASSGPITVITACGEAVGPSDFVVVEGGVVVVHHGKLEAPNQSLLAVFQLMVSNQGPAIALDLHLTNALALGMGLGATNWPATNLASSLPYSAVASQGTNCLEYGLFHWRLGDLPAGAQATFTLKFSQVPPGRLNALATYGVPGGNPVVTNQSALAYVDVPAIPSLVIERTGTSNSLSLWWPSNDPRWKLQSTSGLLIAGPTPWNEVVEVPEENEIKQIVLTNTPGSGNRFFRLVFDTTQVPPTNTTCPCFCEP